MTDYAADIEPTADLATCQKMAQLAADLEAGIAKQEAALKKAKESLRNLVENDLPTAMGEAGVSAFTMADGVTVKIEQKVFASFPNFEKAPERASAAAEWLRLNGHGALLKQTVGLEFRDDDSDAALALLAELEGRYGEGVPKLKLAVHPQTLAAFVREQLRAGAGVPLETLGAHIVIQATLKKAKQA